LESSGRSRPIVCNVDSALTAGEDRRGIAAACTTLIASLRTRGSRRVDIRRSRRHSRRRLRRGPRRETPGFTGATCHIPPIRNVGPRLRRPSHSSRSRSPGLWRSTPHPVPAGYPEPVPGDANGNSEPSVSMSSWHPGSRSVTPNSVHVPTKPHATPATHSRTRRRPCAIGPLEVFPPASDVIVRRCLPPPGTTTRVRRNRAWRLSTLRARRHRNRSPRPEPHRPTDAGFHRCRPCRRYRAPGVCGDFSVVGDAGEWIVVPGPLRERFSRCTTPS
jgi:hypothetical protein